MKNALYILRLTLILLLVTAAVAAALAGINLITRDRIAAAKAQKTLDAISAVLPDTSDPEQIPLSGNTGVVTGLYRCGECYAVEVAPNGFGGAITMMVGIENGCVTGVSVISHAETPGLGAIAGADSPKGESFRGAFTGGDSFVIGENVDAISGATITSKAVVAGVNAAVEFVKEVG